MYYQKDAVMTMKLMVMLIWNDTLQTWNVHKLKKYTMKHENHTQTQQREMLVDRGWIMELCGKDDGKEMELCVK